VIARSLSFDVKSLNKFFFMYNRMTSFDYSLFFATRVLRRNGHPSVNTLPVLVLHVRYRLYTHQRTHSLLKSYLAVIYTCSHNITYGIGTSIRTRIIRGLSVFLRYSSAAGIRIRKWHPASIAGRCTLSLES